MDIVENSMLIGYVSGNSIDRTFMESVISFMSYDAQNRHQVLGLATKHGFFVDDNRNALVRQFLATPAEWLLTIDTDTSFEATAPYVLFDAAKAKEAKIMAALQFSFLDNGSCRPVWFTPAKNGEVTHLGKLTFGELYELAAAGLGLALIHRTVFEAFLKIPEWRNDSWTWFGRDKYGLVGDTAHLGEDVTFCQRAKTLGFQTWGHAGCIAAHAKRWQIGFEEFSILYKANYKGVQE